MHPPFAHATALTSPSCALCLTMVRSATTSCTHAAASDVPHSNLPPSPDHRHDQTPKTPSVSSPGASNPRPISSDSCTSVTFVTDSRTSGHSSFVSSKETFTKCTYGVMDE